MTSLPTNETLIEFNAAVPWQEIERQKRNFNRSLEALQAEPPPQTLSLDELASAVGAPISLYTQDTEGGNAILAHHGEHQYVLGSVVSRRYRGGHLSKVSPLTT